jgi:hypothetical protein
VLTVITLGWYGFFGAIVIMDAGVSASEAAHLAGAVLCGGLIAAGLLPQLVAPARNVAGFQQTLMVAVAVMVAAAIEGNPNNQGGQAGPFDVVFLTFLIPILVLAVLHPARRELLRVRRVHPLLLVAVVAAVPLVVYGVDQALIQRNSWPPTSDPHHNSHWFLMAEAAFAIPLLGAVAGLGGRGWGVPAWTAAAALAVLGIVSFLFPDAPSSLGIGWGLLAIVVAAAVAAVSVLQLRRGRAETARTTAQ